MARTEKKVSRTLLERAIRESEKNGPLKNLDVLWKAAAEFYNANKEDDYPELSFSVILLRAKAWDIQTKTQPGKKGRPAGVPLSEEQKAAMQAGRGKRGKRADKFASQPEVMEGFDELKKRTESRFLPIVDRLTAGSMKAAVALMCIECGGGSTAEVRKCVVNSCPLYAFRPYKGEAKADEEVEIEEIEHEAA